PQSSSHATAGSRVRPSSVSSYSTRGGTSAKTVRDTIPSASSSRSCRVRTRALTGPTRRPSSPNRQGPSIRFLTMVSFHAPPRTATAISTGHTCIAVSTAFRVIETSSSSEIPGHRRWLPLGPYVIAKCVLPIVFPYPDYGDMAEKNSADNGSADNGRVLWVHAHPDDASLGHALVRSGAARLRESGTHVAISDLYAM